MGSSGDESGASGGGTRLIELRSAVMDTFEYHGLAYLACRVGFWALLVAAFFSCYTREQIVNSSNLVSSMATFGPTDWQQTAFRQQTTFAGAASYMLDWATALFNANAAAAGGGDGVGGVGGGSAAAAEAAVTIGDYSTLAHMRLVLDLATNCRHEHLPCAPADGVELHSSLWAHAAPNAPSFLYGAPRHLLSALIYSRASQNDTSVALARLADLSADLHAAVLPRGYAFKLALELVADFSILPGKHAWVALTAQRASSLPTDVGLEKAVSTYIATLDLHGERAAAPRTAALVTCVAALTAVYLAVLGRSVWLYDLQRMHRWRGAAPEEGAPGREPARKAGWAWCIATYFTYSLWNRYDLEDLCVTM
ncbi:hypothetical protein GPECTOR_244g594 [Gonium pectorale]|uniref:Uncharacterized protein n=1 Tax=Gonium pectorale TaxID=33097 RepID=A0A150FWB5_GONPE|nr:hypothetical protein GPECTOR_244g594 [Gonium pectorale]|eukprot:KXZ41913.1 hypothetical protein GPECTOR_244g594 [Gonium pectorale]